MLVLLFIALIALFAFIAWKSREQPYVGGTCCGTAKWPPDDLTGLTPDPTASEPSGQGTRPVAK